MTTVLGASLILFYSLFAGADPCTDAIGLVHDHCASAKPTEGFNDYKNYPITHAGTSAKIISQFGTCGKKVGECYEKCNNDTLTANSGIDAVLRKLRNTYGNPPIIFEIKQCRDAFKVYSDSVVSECEAWEVDNQSTITGAAPLKNLNQKCMLFAKMEGAQDGGNSGNNGSGNNEKDDDDEEDKDKDDGGSQAGNDGGQIPQVTNASIDTSPKFVEMEYGKGGGKPENGKARVEDLGPISTLADRLRHQQTEKSKERRPRRQAENNNNIAPLAPINGSLLNAGGVQGRVAAKPRPNRSGRPAGVKKENIGGDVYMNVAPPQGLPQSKSYQPTKRSGAVAAARANKANNKPTAKRIKLTIDKEAYQQAQGQRPNFVDQKTSVAPNPAGGKSLWNITNDTFKVIRKQNAVYE